jgi:hypothetical protein
MYEGTMAGIISTTEALRNEATRLEIYRQAVLAGFYNEAQGTIAYHSYQIFEEDGLWYVFKCGQYLIRMRELHIAKVWITCRVKNLTLVDANAVVRAEATTQ